MAIPVEADKISRSKGGLLVSSIRGVPQPGISMLNHESAKTEMPGATSLTIMQDLAHFDGVRTELRVYATHTAYKTLHLVFGTKKMPS